MPSVDPVANAEKARRWSRAAISETQDVYAAFSEELTRGPANPDRRAACENDLLLFCKTYGGETFSLPWSDQHRYVAELIQSAVRGGGMAAFAMPRGSGKSSLSRWAVIWSIFYGHSKYSVLIGATATSATRQIKAIKSVLESDEMLWEDFPDVLACVRHIEGQPRRCEGQKFIGKKTFIEWLKDVITMPIIDSLDEEKLRWAVIDVAGITGEIRGRFHTLPGGRGTLRPTLAIVDDPQTKSSARSPYQCDTRLSTLTGDIKYLAGPGEPLGVVMPCTVIELGDLADQLLDRSTHAEWRGSRSRFFEEMPKNIELWEEYGEILRELHRRDMPLDDATAFYAARRAEMDEGFKPTWPERYHHSYEESAVQHGMNAYLRDRRSFFSEYQNDPQPDFEDGAAIPSAAFIAAKQSGFERGIVPNDAVKLTAFIDVSETVLWWTVVAWSRRCDGYVIDYGTFPDQGRAYYTLRDVRIPLRRVAPPGTGMEGCLQHGLEQLVAQIMERQWMQSDGAPMVVNRVAIDTAWGTVSPLIYRFCETIKKHLHRVTPAWGRGTRQFGQSSGRNDFVGIEWRTGKNKKCLVPILFVHTNWWKDFAVARLSTAVGDRGCLQLFGTGDADHRMFADQLTAEYRERASFGDYNYWQYLLPPNKPDNHFFDCLVGCCVLASVEGLSVTSEDAPRPTRRRRKYGVVSQGV